MRWNGIVHFQTLTLLVLLLMAGCQQSADDGTVRLQLNWFPDAQHGGYYAADVHGSFGDQGFDSVKILPGGPGSSGITKLLMGQVDFAIANADQVLMARDQKNTDVVALFAPLQNSPRCIMVHEKSDINSIAELKDITLAMGEGKGFAEFLKTQVPLENVRIVPYSGSVAKFLTDDDYAQQGYVFTEPVVARHRGGAPKALMVSELGFNPYTSVLVTRRDMVEREPERVKRFVAAVKSGWQKYLADEADTNQRILTVNPELDAKMLLEATQIIHGLCLPNGFASENIGTMTDARWQTLAAQLRVLGLIKSESATGAFAAEFASP